MSHDDKDGRESGRAAPGKPQGKGDSRRERGRKPDNPGKPGKPGGDARAPGSKPDGGRKKREPDSPSRDKPERGRDRTRPDDPRRGKPTRTEPGRDATDKPDRPRPGKPASGQAAREGAGKAQAVPQAGRRPDAERAPAGPAPESRLFSPASPAVSELVRVLPGYADIIEACDPLAPKHRALVPKNVAELSRDLTRERGQGLAPNYLSDKGRLAAYARYFLPWNLIRLARLLETLPLDLKDGATIVDVGAGPLTFAQALWLARPELRGKRLTIVCADRTPAPMRLGLSLFRSLAGDTPWRIRLVNAAFPNCLEGGYDLIAAVNALNEQMLGLARGSARGTRRDDLAEILLSSLTPGGRLLAVEPGTRMCGRMIAALRRAVIEAGGAALAPCTHQADCPLFKPDATGWCHFSFGTQGAPAWLNSLTVASGLPKKQLSLSFLYAVSADAPVSDPFAARVVSGEFALPGRPETPVGRYACASVGLMLLASRSRGLGSGDLARLAEAPQAGRLGKDAKSKALVIQV